MLHFSAQNQLALIRIALLSFRGLPPFLLFIGKWAVISSLILSNRNFMFIAAGLAGAVIRLSFYLKFTYSFYLNNEVQLPAISKRSIIGLALVTLSGVYYLLVI